MGDNEEKIEEIEKEIRKTQYNKATQHHIGLLKAKIAKLRHEDEKKAKSGKKGEGYSVRKTGDATIIMLGYPSVGKSTLLNSLTNADSEVASYEFTTLDVIPGMMLLKGAKIQLLDVPGVVEGAASGKGRGKEVLSVMRTADLILFVVAVEKTEQLDILKQEVYDAKIRLNQRKPDVKIKRKEKGGISIGSTVKLTHTTKDTLKEILREMGYLNADAVVRDNVTVDQYIDAIEANRAYIPAISVLNKADLVSEKKAKQLANEIGADIIISAEKKRNLDNLKDLMWNKLSLIRIYMKEPGKPADKKEPLIIKEGSTIKDVCMQVHKDMLKRFKFARVTGPSARFEGQKLMQGHALLDEDVLELHLR
ncbi:OBG GTPase family GTP-binding protein [Nanoarchaeota archaeon]